MSRYVSARPVGASDKAIQQTSKFLSGAYTWGSNDNQIIYARVSESECTPVGVDRGDMGISFFISECNKAMKYHQSSN